MYHLTKRCNVEIQLQIKQRQSGTNNLTERLINCAQYALESYFPLLLMHGIWEMGLPWKGKNVKSLARCFISVMYGSLAKLCVERIDRSIIFGMLSVFQFWFVFCFRNRENNRTVTISLHLLNKSQLKIIRGRVKHFKITQKTMNNWPSPPSIFFQI